MPLKLRLGGWRGPKIPPAGSRMLWIDLYPGHHMDQSRHTLHPHHLLPPIPGANLKAWEKICRYRSYQMLRWAGRYPHSEYAVCWRPLMWWEDESMCVRDDAWNSHIENATNHINSSSGQYHRHKTEGTSSFIRSELWLLIAIATCKFQTRVCWSGVSAVVHLKHDWT